MIPNKNWINFDIVVLERFFCLRGRCCELGTRPNLVFICTVRPHAMRTQNDCSESSQHVKDAFVVFDDSWMSTRLASHTASFSKPSTMSQTFLILMNPSSNKFTSYT